MDAETDAENQLIMLEDALVQGLALVDALDRLQNEYQREYND